MKSGFRGFAAIPNRFPRRNLRSDEIDPWFLDQLWQIVRREQESREAAKVERRVEQAFSLSEGF